MHHICRFFKDFQGWWFHHFSLGTLFLCLTTFSVNKIFLVPNLNLPWHKLRPFSAILPLVTWKKRQPPPHYNLLLGSCREWWGPPESLFLQPEEPQLTHLLLMENWISLYAWPNMKYGNLVAFILKIYCLLSTSYETIILFSQIK